MKLVMAPAAISELHDAAAFYTLKANVKLGLTFVAEFERAANLILEKPLLGAEFRNNRPAITANTRSTKIQISPSICKRITHPPA